MRQALNHPVFFLTGGPGTGKTHTAGLLIRAMKEADPNLLIGVAAPTGKAVSQLKKSLLKQSNNTFLKQKNKDFISPDASWIDKNEKN